SVYIPDKVTTIGDNAFLNMTSAPGRNISMNQFLQGDNPTVAKYGLTQTQWDSINWRTTRVPFQGTTLDRAAVTSIDWNTQTTITLSDWTTWAPNVTTIATGAFSDLSLTSIFIPDKVTIIQTNAFQNTNSLLGSNVSMLETLKGANPTVAKYGFTQTQWDSINWRTTRVPFQGTTLDRVAITSIGWDTQTEITLSDWTTWAPNVTLIATGAFEGLPLMSIELPNKVTAIGNNAFRNTNSLSSISINSLSELKSIGNNAFENSRITSINLSKTVTTIGTDAFKNTPSLMSITFPYSVYREGVIPYGLTSAQWSSVIWKDFPTSGTIDKLIAKNLLKENDNTIEWENIKNFSNIAPEAFMDTDIKYIEIQAKQGFTIGSNAFKNTFSLEDIVLDESYKSIVDTLGFTEEQIKKINFNDTKPSSNNTGAIVGSIFGILAVVGLGVGGFFYWKYIQKKKTVVDSDNN
ncbi:MAG: leucine-rich repeat protein, partial [Metamycoplasmataceae bacterium]